jgi:putative flippase GtrA
MRKLMLQSAISAGVGMTGTGLLCSLMYFFTEKMGWWYVLSFSIASIPYYLWSFYGHKYAVFKNLGKKDLVAQMKKFGLMKVVLSLINWAILCLVLNYFHIEEHYIYVQLSIAAVFFSVGFVISRKKIFV